MAACWKSLTLTYTQKHAWKHAIHSDSMTWIEYCCRCHYYSPRRMCGVDYLRGSCSIVSNLGGLAEWGSEEYPDYIFNLFRQNDVMIRRGNWPKSKHPPRTENGERGESERDREWDQRTAALWGETARLMLVSTPNTQCECAGSAQRPDVLIRVLLLCPSPRWTWWSDVRQKAEASRRHWYYRMNHTETSPAHISAQIPKKIKPFLHYFWEYFQHLWNFFMYTVSGFYVHISTNTW